MDILLNSIHVIDYENKKIYRKEVPETFNEYISELINYLSLNDKVRAYKTSSNNTLVISNIRNIYTNKLKKDNIENCTEEIANKLLREEVKVQKKLKKLNSKVQRGCLIQALIKTDDGDKYLLAKVEHTSFVDDIAFRTWSGFSKEKNIWKSCIFDIISEYEEQYSAYVYLNNPAKYWTENFLELVEMRDDEMNTNMSFKSIDACLNRTLKKSYPQDLYILRNSIIAYYRNHDYIIYDKMIDSVIGEKYIPVKMTTDKVSELRKKLKKLPKDKKFDYQFTTVMSVISARIKKVYDLNDGIKLNITSGVKDLKEMIVSYRDEKGNQYVRIKTNNQDTFNTFPQINI